MQAEAESSSQDGDVETSELHSLDDTALSSAILSVGDKDGPSSIPSDTDESSILTILAHDDTPASQTVLNIEKIESVTEQNAIRDLSAALPAFPVSRLRKIRNAFKSTLGSPSLLTLVPLLREKVPDYVTLTWLKAMNIQNAEYILKKASEAGIVDVHLLNSMLQVKTNSGNLEKALQFHDEEFQKHGLVSDWILCSFGDEKLELLNARESHLKVHTLSWLP